MATLPPGFIQALFTGLGVSNPSPTQAAMVQAWANAEGMPAYANNPFATTQESPAVSGIWNSIGVKTYTTPQAGAAATVATLEQNYPGYAGIKQALIGGDVPGFTQSLSISPWSGASTAAGRASYANKIGSMIADIAGSGAFSVAQITGKLVAPFQTEGVSAATAATSPAMATGNAQASGTGLPGPVPGIANVGTLVGQVLDPRNWWRLLLYLAGAALVAIGLVIYVWGGNAGPGAKRAISQLPIVP